jgi:hypothetical protein
VTPVGGRIELSVVEVVGRRLVELEVGNGLGIGEVEARRLVEHEVTLGWGSVATEANATPQLQCACAEHQDPTDHHERVDLTSLEWMKGPRLHLGSALLREPIARVGIVVDSMLLLELGDLSQLSLRMWAHAVIRVE